MHDTQSRTESLLDTVRGIQNRTIMLPEFQRDVHRNTGVYLERTGKPLGALREQDSAASDEV